jgi:hypothetical protein
MAALGDSPVPDDLGFRIIAELLLESLEESRRVATDND